MGNNPPKNRHSDGHAALASVVFRAAWAIIFSSSAYAVQFAYIPCDDGTVKVINVATHSVVKTLIVGGAPVGVAVSPALHQVFVTNSDDDSISVIDTPGTDTASDSVKPPILRRGRSPGRRGQPGRHAHLCDELHRQQRPGDRRQHGGRH